jgi:hypothetical protein
MAFGKELVRVGIFASDKHKPSIRYGEPGQASNKPLASGSRAVQSSAPSDPFGPGSRARARNMLPALGSGASPPLALTDPKVTEIDEDPMGEFDEDPTAGSDPLPDWRIPYLDSLIREVLPMDKTEARRLTRRVKSFIIVKGELYKKSHTKVLQHCIPTEQRRRLLKDIHGRTCGHHIMSKTLVKNAFRQGCYWPTAMANAKKIVRTYEGCQYYARQTHLLAQALQTIPINWRIAV